MNLMHNNYSKILLTYVLYYFFFQIPFSVSAQRYNFSTYTISNGLPANYILKLTQDRSGYIWIGTMNGVCRFNGYTFENFESNFILSHSPVTSLAEDQDNNMWIGTTGKGLAKFNGNKFTLYNMDDGLCSNNISSLCADHNGKLFIGTDSGLCVYNGNRFTTFRTRDGLPDNRIISVLCNSKNEIWISTYNGLAKYVNGEFKVYNASNGLPSNINYCMFLTADDVLWLSSSKSLVSYNDTSFLEYPLEKKLTADHAQSIIQDHNGVFWFATDGYGFGKLKNNNLELIDAHAGLCNNSVNSIMEDREGNLWLGTKNGLSKFGGDRFVMYSNSEGLSSSNINTVSIDKDKNLWVGTVAGGLINFSDQKIISYGANQGIKSSTVWCIFHDSQNKLWVGTTDGVFCKDQKQKVFSKPFDWLNNMIVYSITEDESHRLYFGTNNGLYILDKNGHQQINFKKGLTNTSVRSLLFDSKGIIWIGTLQGMFYLSKDSAISFYPTIIPKAPITSIIEDPNSSIVFNVFDFGIYIYSRKTTQKLFTINASNSNIDPAVTFVYIDNSGYMWAGNYKGIDRFNWIQYLKNKKVNVDQFRKTTGYFGETSNAACSDTMGNVWIASVNGLVKFNKDAGEPIQILPKLVINNLRLFLNDVNWKALGFEVNELTGLPQNPEFNDKQNQISFSFGAIYFTAAEEIKYSFKLEGFDKNWSPSTIHKVAYYANLRPGNYIFKVKTTLDGKTWTPPVEYAFSIRSPWWKEPIMYVLYAVVSLSIIMFIFKIRTRALQKSRNNLAKKVMERTSELNLKNIELEKLSLVASKTDNAVLIFNDKLELEYVNSGFNKMTGYNMADFIKLRGSKLKELTYCKDIDTLLPDAINNNKSVIYESLMHRKNGMDLYVSSTLTPIFTNKGDLQNVVVIDTDITAGKIMEVQLKQALNERGILLKEIHHRVKNNLQIIISLLNLQTYYITDEVAIRALKEGQLRVRSMALIHERFYQSEDLSKIAFDDYVYRLTDNLFLSYSVSQENIKVLMESDKVSLDIDTAVPCGLIINELISNSLKHAFTKSDKGEIRIEFREINKNQYKLIISDNGKGLPENIDIAKSDTFGMQLINALAEQIEGKYKFESKNGLTFTLEFNHSNF